MARFPSKLVVLGCVATLAGCGPDVGAWKGQWAGSVVVNTGRIPLTYAGTLTIADGARFTGTTTSGGQTLTCALSASTIDGTTASFAIGSECTVTAGDCSSVIRFEQLEVVRSGDALSATGRGRSTVTCTSGNSVEDVSLTGAATRG